MLSPFHPLVDELLSKNSKIAEEVSKLRSQKISEESISRNEKIGINTDISIKHPFIKNKKLPVYVAILFLWTMDQELYMAVLLMIKET